MKITSLITVLLLATSPLGFLHADEAATESKLREALRNTELQLQSVQDQNAQLLTAKAASDKAVQDTKDQLAAAIKQAKSDKDAADSEHAKLASQVIVLQRQLDDAIAKNLALYKLGNDILTRYEKFGLGDALGAKEPFTQISRVKLENFVQEYQDKMSDQKLKPGEAISSPASAAETKSDGDKVVPTKT